jgi:hypothetical protein
MTDNVVTLPVMTTLDLPPERVLLAAAEKKLDRVVVLGINPDGSMYLAASHSSAPQTLWDLEKAKEWLLVHVP